MLIRKYPPLLPGSTEGMDGRLGDGGVRVCLSRDWCTDMFVGTNNFKRFSRYPIRPRVCYSLLTDR